MFENSIFALGLIVPLALFLVGHLLIGLLFSVIAIVVRFQARSRPVTVGSQRKVDWAIVFFAASVLSSMLGASLLHIERDLGIAERLVIVGWLLWPVSGVLTIAGKGAGRGPLLVGHGVIAFLLIGLLIALWIHG